MPKGGKCGFCGLPDAIREPCLTLWRDGASVNQVAAFAAEKGFPLVSAGILNNCLSRSKHHGDRGATPAERTDVKLSKIVELLEKNNVPVEDIGKVKTVRMSEWQGMYAEVVSCETCHGTGGEEDAPCPDCNGKQTRRVPRVVDMSATSIVLHPSWDEGPKWVPVDRGKPVVVKPAKAGNKPAAGYQAAVVLPDTQIGYWRDIETGALTPFHDEAAIAVALDVIRQLRPDTVVLLGDYLDFAPLSDKFMREAGFALTIQPALDYGVELLGKIRALVPNAKIALIEGNHDRRLQKAILNNNLDCFGVKRGMSAPESWPVFSVPYLLRLDELDVEYVAGYPAGEFWINDNLVCIHGRIVRGGNQSTAAAVVDDERVSVIFGHVHRIEVKHKTRRVRHGAKQAQAVSAGCLCRIDGTVPSAKGATDVFGRPVPAVEDWQQGVCVVTYEPGDGPFGIEVIPIYTGANRVTFFRGREVTVA